MGKKLMQKIARMSALALSLTLGVCAATVYNVDRDTVRILTAEAAESELAPILSEVYATDTKVNGSQQKIALIFDMPIEIVGDLKNVLEISQTNESGAKATIVSAEVGSNSNIIEIYVSNSASSDEDEEEEEEEEKEEEKKSSTLSEDASTSSGTWSWTTKDKLYIKYTPDANNYIQSTEDYGSTKVESFAKLLTSSEEAYIDVFEPKLQSAITFVRATAESTTEVTLTANSYILEGSNFTFDESLFSFSVTTASGETRTVKATGIKEISGKNITLELNNPIYGNDSVSVKYIADIDTGKGKNLTDIFGTDMETGSSYISIDVSELEDRDITPPELDQDEMPIYNYKDQTLIITFKEDIELYDTSEDLSTLKNFFTIKTGSTYSSNKVIKSIEKESSNQIKFTLSSEIKYGDPIKIEYEDLDVETPEEDDTIKITDTAGNRIDSFSVTYTAVNYYLEEGDIIKDATGYTFEVLEDGTVAFLGLNAQTANLTLTETNTTKNGYISGVFVTTSTEREVSSSKTRAVSQEGESLLISTIGNGEGSLQGSLSSDALNNIGIEATKISDNALNSVSLSGTSLLAFPKVTEIGKLGLAMSSTSNVTTVSLPSYTDTLSAKTVFGTSSSVTSVILADTSKLDSTGTIIKATQLESTKVKEAKISKTVPNKIVITFDKNIRILQDDGTGVTVTATKNGKERNVTVSSLTSASSVLYVNLDEDLSYLDTVTISISSGVINDVNGQVVTLSTNVTNNLVNSSSTSKGNSSTVVSASSSSSSGGSTSTGGSGGSSSSANTNTNTANNSGEGEKDTIAKITTAAEPNTLYKTEETTVSSSKYKTLSITEINLPEMTGETVTFTDVPLNHWAYEHISKLSSAGIVTGLPDGTFDVNGTTRRADVALMTIRLLGLEGTPSSNFADVPSTAYYADAVGLAKEYGLINGTSSTTFSPTSSITRQDMIVILARVLEKLGIELDTDTSCLERFSDSSQISDYALEKVAALVNAGVINGSNGKINPKSPITRAEISTLMDKIYNIIEEEKEKVTNTVYYKKEDEELEVVIEETVVV